MKFLVDAQLPRRLVRQLHAGGYEAVHTLDLPQGNRTSDSEINELSLREGYIVVSKDADFVNSFYLHHKSHKLLLISTGNIRNVDLEAILSANLAQICKGFNSYDFIEMDHKRIIFHV